MSHTPGPWTAELVDGEYRLMAPSKEHGVRGYLGGLLRGGPHSASNARLIASAPDMLEALKSFPGFTDDATVGDPWIERVRAAIARAEGRS